MGQATSGPQLEDHYYLQKVKLGQGSFGTVWRAVDRQNGELAAIKQLEKRRMPQRGVKRNHIEREISIMRACKHENITELYNTFESAESIYIALEYCDGGDFGDKVKERGMSISEHEVAEFLCQICSAIDALHCKAIVHRDIKPDNFMLKAAGPSQGGRSMLKVSDFGLAIFLPQGKLLIEKCGTPAFMSPEIHLLPQRSRGYGFPADVWAAGVTLYVVMFGARHPFLDERGQLDMKLLLKAGLDFRESVGKSSFLSLDTFNSSLRFSEQARQLCRHMVLPDPLARTTAKQAAGAASSWLSSLQGSTTRDRTATAVSDRPSKGSTQGMSFERGGTASLPFISNLSSADTLADATMSKPAAPGSSLCTPRREFQRGAVSAPVAAIGTFSPLQSPPAAQDEELKQAQLECQCLKERADSWEADAAVKSEELRKAEVRCQDMKMQAEKKDAEAHATYEELQKVVRVCEELKDRVLQSDGEFTLRSQELHDMHNGFQEYLHKAELTHNQRLRLADDQIQCLRRQADFAEAENQRMTESLSSSVAQCQELQQRLESLQASVFQKVGQACWDLQQRAVNNDEVQDTAALCKSLKEWAEQSSREAKDQTVELQNARAECQYLRELVKKCEAEAVAKADAFRKVAMQAHDGGHEEVLSLLGHGLADAREPSESSGHKAEEEQRREAGVIGAIATEAVDSDAEDIETGSARERELLDQLQKLKEQLATREAREEQLLEQIRLRPAPQTEGQADTCPRSPPSRRCCGRWQPRSCRQK